MCLHSFLYYSQHNLRRATIFNALRHPPAHNLIKTSNTRACKRVVGIFFHTPPLQRGRQAGIAQRQSSCLVSIRSRVRIPLPAPDTNHRRDLHGNDH